MFWFILLLAQAALAGAVPQSSDVVLIYEGADIEAQTKDNYLFTVDSDDTFYPCSTNRCSLANFSDSAQITLTIYKLPEGYPRVENILNQEVLAEYAAAADITYTVPGVATNPVVTGSAGRTFQELQLKADGSFTLNTVNQERNAQLQDKTEAAGAWPVYIWYIVGGVVVLGGVGLGLWLWKRKF